ncbi:MinD/ParA family ATP-binding protein [Mycobacteroides salmoniphilum]|uniref:CobQ/CobB/MinD/ParA nucleotide binding domain protein n=1 Tax=Mycobacteroides salmoniphilum TaxID=404941 RepID=A0A4R8SZS3_9MYCO|nr:MinD/ParA family protein [Mycobacteroides salmoniphilum]TEA09130.1 CobQ/CobB/MinD/ParA nucleotide binding domain protein [Mycobacteroides salmoniphilum]
MSNAYGPFTGPDSDDREADTDPSAFTPPPFAGGGQHAGGYGADGYAGGQYAAERAPAPPAAVAQQQQEAARSGWEMAAHRQQQARNAAQFAPEYSGPALPPAQTQVMPAVQAANPAWSVANAPATADAGRHRSAAAMGLVKATSVAKLPPERGWRRWLLVLTRWNVGLSPDEVYERDLHAQVRRIVTPAPGTVAGFKVAVLALKGGVGKTITSVLLGSVTAVIRGERILAVDADPDDGNLIDRAREEPETSSTVAQLVSSANELTGYNAVRNLTNQNDANLEVLAGADYVDAVKEFDGADWNTTARVVSHYYPIVVADCGVGLHTSASRAILDDVWAVVVVTNVSPDSAKSAGRVFDWLRANGYADLAERSVAVVNHTKRGRSKVVAEKIKDGLRKAMGDNADGRVFELPFDGHIEEGEAIDIRLVSPVIRRRVTEIAAALSVYFDKPRIARQAR